MSDEAKHPSGKGHATPSRKKAEEERKKQFKPARGSKEARELQRKREWEERTRTRLAMYTLDEKHLPLRERGPVKKFARDFVDIRISVGELFIPFAFLVMLLLFIPNASIQNLALSIWYVMLFGMIVDSAILALRLRRALAKNFPNESPRGLATYAILRAVTLRSMRLPRPAIKVGGAPKPVKLPRSLRK